MEDFLHRENMIIFRGSSLKPKAMRNGNCC